MKVIKPQYDVSQPRSNCQNRQNTPRPGRLNISLSSRSICCWFKLPDVNRPDFMRTEKRCELVVIFSYHMNGPTRTRTDPSERTYQNVSSSAHLHRLVQSGTNGSLTENRSWRKKMQTEPENHAELCNCWDSFMLLGLNLCFSQLFQTQKMSPVDSVSCRKLKEYMKL